MSNKGKAGLGPNNKTEGDGRRVLSTGTPSPRGAISLTRRKREIYKESLTPAEERQHQLFCDLQQESIRNCERRLADEKARLEQQGLKKELEQNALKRKKELDEATAKRGWDKENEERVYYGLSPLPEPAPLNSFTEVVDPMKAPLPPAESHHGYLKLVQPSTLTKEPDAIIPTNTQKRRDVGTILYETRGAESIEKGRIKRAKVRDAMTAALAEVPGWVSERIGAKANPIPTGPHQVPILGPILPPAPSCRIMKSKAEARAHELISRCRETVAKLNQIPKAKNQNFPVPISAYKPIQSGENSNSAVPDPAGGNCPANPVNRQIDSFPNAPGPKCLPGYNRRENQYSVYVHELINSPNGPLVKRTSMVLNKLNSKMKLETFRRKVLGLYRGDVSGNHWARYFIAFLKGIKSGGSQEWLFIQGNEDYVTFLNYILNENEDQLHHVVTGDSKNAHLLPTINATWGPTAATGSALGSAINLLSPSPMQHTAGIQHSETPNNQGDTLSSISRLRPKAVPDIGALNGPDLNFKNVFSSYTADHLFSGATGLQGINPGPQPNPSASGGALGPIRIPSCHQTSLPADFHVPRFFADLETVNITTDQGTVPIQLVNPPFLAAMTGYCGPKSLDKSSIFRPSPSTSDHNDIKSSEKMSVSIAGPAVGGDGGGPSTSLDPLPAANGDGQKMNTDISPTSDPAHATNTYGRTSPSNNSIYDILNNPDPAIPEEVQPAEDDFFSFLMADNNLSALDPHDFNNFLA